MPKPTKGILSDKELIKLCRQGMITPFEETGIRINEQGTRVLSYGIGHYGYDIRLSPSRFMLFTAMTNTVFDAKRPEEACLVDIELSHDLQTGEMWFELPPHGTALGVSLERFAMPADVMGIALGKSTNARAGLLVNITPLEPSWQGDLVIEISNLTPLTQRIYANEGIAQIVFFRGEKPNTTYSGKKYNGQTGITLGKV